MESNGEGLTQIQVFAYHLREIPHVRERLEQWLSELGNRNGQPLTVRYLSLLLAQELHEKLQSGSSDFEATFQDLRSRVRLCARCHWPFASNRSHRTICGSESCASRRRAEQERTRELRRKHFGGLTGTSAEQKRDARLMSKLVRRDPRDIDADIDAALRKIGDAEQRTWVGRRHCREGRQYVAYRTKIIAFLRSRAELRDVEIAYRLILKPPRK